MDQNSNKMKAVVLISGGMDSCVTAAIASQNYQIAALHASYGQPTERRELQSFHSLADYFGAVERMAVNAYDMGARDMEGLLGQDFLGHFNVSIDPTLGIVTLKPR